MEARVLIHHGSINPSQRQVSILGGSNHGGKFWIGRGYYSRRQVGLGGSGGKY